MSSFPNTVAWVPSAVSTSMFHWKDSVGPKLLKVMVNDDAPSVTVAGVSRPVMAAVPPKGVKGVPALEFGEPPVTVSKTNALGFAVDRSRWKARTFSPAVELLVMVNGWLKVSPLTINVRMGAVWACDPKTNRASAARSGTARRNIRSPFLLLRSRWVTTGEGAPPAQRKGCRLG